MVIKEKEESIMNKTEFIETQFPKLDFFTTQIVKVHGQRHPELDEVRQVFVKIKQNLTADESADNRPEFERLESITSNYTVPGDACEAYNATYKMLQYFDQLDVQEA